MNIPEAMSREQTVIGSVPTSQLSDNQQSYCTTTRFLGCPDSE